MWHSEVQLYFSSLPDKFLFLNFVGGGHLGKKCVKSLFQGNDNEKSLGNTESD